jgi:hypothetical protein
MGGADEERIGARELPSGDGGEESRPGDRQFPRVGKSGEAGRALGIDDRLGDGAAAIDDVLDGGEPGDAEGDASAVRLGAAHESAEACLGGGRRQRYDERAAAEYQRQPDEPPPGAPGPSQAGHDPTGLKPGGQKNRSP